MKTYDVVVVGAGPAGLAAAIEAAGAGLSVLVLDEAPAPGGQIYRGVERAGARMGEILGPDYGAGADLIAAFRDSDAVYVPGATVWNVDANLTVDHTCPGGGARASAGALIVATGAVERPVPVPGWTLPGVSTAGALQILMKEGGLVANDAVFAGCGPLLWLVAGQMVAAGSPPRAVVETVPRRRYLRAARHFTGALRAPAYLRKGLAMIAKVRQAGVAVHASATDLSIEGEDRATALRFTSNGRAQRIETGTVALHEGVVPNQQITRLLRCEHAWNAGQRCFAPVLGPDFQTSVPNVYVAGDGGGIGGSATAALRGQLVARHIAAAQGRAAEPAQALRREMARDAAVRPFLETLYAPSVQSLAPADDTVVCRCEEITAGQIREAVDLGAPGPNQVKSFLRAGMGPCQGRVCGLAVAEIIAARRGENPADVGYYRIRPPLKPLPLADLAAMAHGDEDEAA